MNIFEEYEWYMAKTHDKNTAALLTMALGIADLARAVKLLGNADAATPMGAMEAFGLVMKDGLGGIASAIESITDPSQEKWNEGDDSDVSSDEYDEQR
jgi:hypothetical protein